MPLLTRLRAHSHGFWEHSRLGSSGADLRRLTKFCSLTHLDLHSLNGWLDNLPILLQLRVLNLGNAQLYPPDLDYLRKFSSLDTLHLEITKPTQLDITLLQELHSLRCLAITLCPYIGGHPTSPLDSFLAGAGECGGLTQLTGFTMLVYTPCAPFGVLHCCKSAQYGWMRNLLSLELATVGPYHSKQPYQRGPLDVLLLNELRRLCEEVPQLRCLTLTTSSCNVHLTECLSSLTGLTALNLTMGNYEGVQAVESFQRLPLQVVNSLEFCDTRPYPFKFYQCANLVSLTCFRAMTGDEIRHLLQLNKLRSLELDHGIHHSCTPAEIRNLGRLTGLTKLQLGFESCAHPLDCMLAVGELSGLSQLDLQMPWRAYQEMWLRKRDCMGSLRGLDALMRVCISEIMGAMTLLPLRALTTLTLLEVLPRSLICTDSSRKDWAVKALRDLSALTSLRELTIHRLDDADVPMLANLTQLTNLRVLAESKVSIVSRVFRTKHKRRTEILSKLPYLLYFSIPSHG